MFKSILATTVATITLLYAPIASASQWVLVGGSPFSHQVFVDIDSIRGTGNTRTFWDKHIYSEDQYPSRYLGSYSSYRSATSLIFVDCSSNKIGFLAAVYYDRNGEVIGGFDDSYLNTPQYLMTVVPDSFGEAELDYICGLRTDFESNNHLPVSSPAYVTSLSQEQSISIVNQWLQAKHTIFAPPYSLDAINSITTGTLHRDLTSANSPVNWLINNNAYYRFGIQRVESVNNFLPGSDHTTIELTVTEERTLFVNGQVDAQASGTETFDIRYFLEMENGKWKISDYRILD